MGRSGSAEPRRLPAVPRAAVLALLALSFCLGQSAAWGFRWCEWGSSSACRASITAAELIGAAFPFGLVTFALAFVPIHAALKIAISAVVGGGVAYAVWRRLPPRLTLRSFAFLMAGWLVISIVTAGLGLGVMLLSLEIF